MKRLIHLDRRMFEWVAHFSNDKMPAKVILLFKWISKTGDGYLYFVIASLLYFFDHTHGALFFYTALLAYCFEIPIYLTLKHFFKRPRPLDLLKNFDAIIVPSDKFSLPSGHTAAAFLMATIVIHYYPSLSILALIWAMMVGLSRVVLRVHYPCDVLLGALLGIAFAITSINLLG